MRCGCRELDVGFYGTGRLHQAIVLDCQRGGTPLEIVPRTQCEMALEIGTILPRQRDTRGHLMSVADVNALDLTFCEPIESALAVALGALRVALFHVTEGDCQLQPWCRQFELMRVVQIGIPHARRLVAPACRGQQQHVLFRAGEVVDVGFGYFRQGRFDHLKRLI